MANNPIHHKLFIDPLYSRGEYYDKSTGEKDAAYKIDQLRNLLLFNPRCIPNRICRIADVGCGSGKTTFLLQEMLKNFSGSLPLVDGYDIHPYIDKFTGGNSVRFFSGDFCSIADGIYDLVVLFDVIEHVLAPLSFLRNVSEHSRLLAFHIPLDDTILSWVRNLPRENISHPGHILVLDLPAAINLIALSGLRIIDFQYSPGFRAPSGKETYNQKLLYPIRATLYRFSPYITQKLIGGVSVTVLAWTIKGLSDQS
jgi:SAM-dependent methyltransferase